MYKPALIAGAFFGALAVIFGAFGAHGVRSLVSPDLYVIYEKAAAYQFYHTFALLAVGILYASFPCKALRLAGSFFITGIVLFSGSLYGLVALEYHNMQPGMFGIVTPVGGLFLIAGWVALLAGILKKK